MTRAYQPRPNEIIGYCEKCNQARGKSRAIVNCVGEHYCMICSTLLTQKEK